MAENISKNTIKIDIVSAEEAIYTGHATMVVATGILGEIGILPGHAPLLTLLQPGQIRVYLENNEEMIFYVTGGILEVQPNEVSVLSDTAVRADNIDEAAALEARERAERLLHEKTADIDYSKVLGELAQAAAKIRAVRALKKKVK